MTHRRHTVRSIIEKQLTPEQRETLHEWFRQKFTYNQIITRIYGAFGVKLSANAVGAYYQRRFLAAELQRKAEARGVEAAGIEVIILFPEPGRVHVQVRPLQS